MYIGRSLKRTTMAFILLILLIGVPLAEIALFIEIGGWIGLWPTIATVVLTALFGTALLRQQGLATLQRAQRELNSQRLPVRELFDGACLLVAGVLLLTPGFLTDAIGFMLLVPPLRLLIGMAAWRALQRHGTVHVRTAGFSHRRSPTEPDATGGGAGPVIEGEYQDLSDRRGGNDGETREDPDPGRNSADSPWRRNVG